MSYSLPTLLLASALLALVAGWDIAKRRIPNWANAALGVTGLAAQALHHGGEGALSGLGAGFLTLVMLWIPWTRRRLGGGDLKATVSAATWMGMASLIPFYLYAAVAAGLVSMICFLASNQVARREIQQNMRLVMVRVGLPEAPIRGGGGRVSVPFGAAMAGAALLLLWWTP